MDTWQLQDAKNKFSQVVNLAETGKPQYITRHGKPVAVLSSVEDFEKFHPRAKEEMNFKEFLLNLPKLPAEWYADGDPFARVNSPSRDFDW